MSLIEIDVKALEWCAAVHLSGDKIALQELVDGIDTHHENERAFKLPDRLTAKKFLFRMLFGGNAYAYSGDWEFSWISESPKYWQKVIDSFYEKYQGIYRWHNELIDIVGRTGKLVMETGRVYEFKLNKRYELPRTLILNYPVQGLGADIMAILRVVLARKIKPYKDLIKLRSTIHDSILIDYHNECSNILLGLLSSTFEEFPEHYRDKFFQRFSVPIRYEIKTSPSVWGEMRELKQDGI